MLNSVLSIARNAGKMITDATGLHVEKKPGHANFVTNMDKAVQAYLEKALCELVPGSRFIGEEKDCEGLTNEPTWIVDPVDGTTNLIHDFRHSAVSIALTQNGAPVIGVIYQPYVDEMFYAEKCKGAYLNGTPIHVSDMPYGDALVAFGSSPYDPALARAGIRICCQYLLECADVRRTGSCAIDLCNLACGRVDLFFELQLSPWDVAAGALIVEEAGGVFRMPLRDDGVKFEGKNAVFASNAVCADHALKVFFDTLRSDAQ